MSRAAGRRSECPLACTLDLIGDKWTLLVIRDLMCGKHSFKAFTQSPERIATNILTNRLERLVDHGIVDRYVNEDHAGRYTYELTEKGRSLFPILESIAEWGLENIQGTVQRMRPKT
ncbi:MAG: helix-turn-helix domain-containing protein [Planctomycetota bacterium]|nr:helix-turn-helix domain-containing protein [Planctomycetota bacterium]